MRSTECTSSLFTQSVITHENVHGCRPNMVGMGKGRHSRSG